MQLFSSPPRQSFSPVVIPDDVPVYRIGEDKFYADDELYEAGSVIVWSEEPNITMEPLNGLARARMQEFLAKLDEHGRAAAEKAGKAYISLAHAFENAHEIAKKEGRRVEMLNAKQEVPIMGGRKTRAPKAKRVDVTALQEEFRLDSNNKHSLNSPKAANQAVGVGM